MLAILARVLNPKPRDANKKKSKNRVVEPSTDLGMNQEEKDAIFDTVIDKLAQNILSQQRSSRQVATRVLKSIAKTKDKSLSEILSNANCSIYIPPPQAQR